MYKAWVLSPQKNTEAICSRGVAQGKDGVGLYSQGLTPCTCLILAYVPGEPPTHSFSGLPGLKPTEGRPRPTPFILARYRHCLAWLAFILTTPPSLCRCADRELAPSLRTAPVSQHHTGDLLLAPSGAASDTHVHTQHCCPAEGGKRSVLGHPQSQQAGRPTPLSLLAGRQASVKQQVP